MVFGCISKNFPENIFWCLKKKKENTNEGKNTSHNAGKNRPTTAPSIAIFASSRRRSRSRSGAILRRQDRDLREIAPSIAISIRCARSQSTASRDRRLEIAINVSAGSRTGDRGRGLEIAINDGEIADWRSRSRARALSLSLSFSGNTLKGK